MADEQEKSEPDLAGYPDTESLAKGYRESGNEAKRQRERAERAEAAFQSMQSQMGAANPRQDVAFRTPYDRLNEYGVPADIVRELVQSETDIRVKQALSPLMDGMQARTRLMGKYKDYSKHEADAIAYVQSDPDLNQTWNRMFPVDATGALELAYLAYGEKRRRDHPGKSAPDTDDRSEAQIPSNRQGDARRAPQGADAEVQALRKQYQESPNRKNAEAYAQARLHGVIKDDFLNQ
jgi:hypothetical protein